MHVVVVRLVLTFFVVGLTLVLVLGVLVVLLGGMLALWSMRRAWLEFLVAAIRRSLVLLFLFALDRCDCHPATCSCDNDTCCFACCDDCHLLDIVP
jgi:hypothetical protein